MYSVMALSKKEHRDLTTDLISLTQRFVDLCEEDAPESAVQAKCMIADLRESLGEKPAFC
jgi:hypothetical protein